MDSGSGQRVDVLVVDDDADIRESVQEILAAEGYQVAVAQNGADALMLLRNGVDPRLILLDLMMPVMDGETFCHRCQRDETLQKIPVVIISAHATSAEKAASCQALGLLRKPFRLEDLLGTVGRFMTQPASSLS